MWKKFVSGLLAAFMLFSGVPVSALSIESDWIVEFMSEEAARIYLSDSGGRWLGGSMVLTRGTRGDFELMPGVASLTADGTVKGSSVTVNDPKKSEQAYLSDRAFNPYGGGWDYLNEALAGKQLTEADASPVRVAVIDTGVDASHPDLVNRVADGYDAVNDAPLPAGVNSDLSSDSHGTMVAGLIAAEADNDEGIAGISYTLPVSVVPVRALDASANGKLSDIISAIYWAVDQGDADIINMSFGIRMKTRPAALESAIRYAEDKNVMLIAAAGNEGRTVTYSNYNYYPAAMEGVMAVGSVTAAQYSRYYGYVPYYSGFTNQLSSTEAAYVGKSFFYVPGEDLLTTVKDGGYAEFTGTSASAALFSGMMASLMSVSRAIDGIDPRAAVSTSSGGYSSVKYHSFYTAAYNLQNGSAVDAWWVGDYHQPAILRGDVAVTGTLMDPSHKMQSVRVDLVNASEEVSELYSGAREVDAVSQIVSFDIKTSRLADGDYHYDVIGTYAEDDSEITLATVNFTVDNAGKNYLLSAREEGQPLVSAEVVIFDGGGGRLQDGTTDTAWAISP